MTLLPWSHNTRAGFALRGWHSPPSGKPLLHFTHGNGFCSRTYEPMLERLAQYFDLWLCDQQGQGESDHGGDFVGWNRSAELVYEAFEAGRGIFGEVPRYACGHSFGAVQTSLIVAAHPQLFQRVVLLDPVLFPPKLILLRSTIGRFMRNPMVDGALARREQWSDRRTAYDKLYNRGIFRGWDDAAFRAHIKHALKDDGARGVRLKCQPSREAEVFDTMPKGLWRALRRVRTPVCLVHGDRTYPFVIESAARWARLNQHVSIAQVPGGHCFMQELPELAAQRVLDFLLAD